MALDFKFDILEQPDGKSFILQDLTGNYSATTNTGGWGGINIITADVYKIHLEIRDYPYDVLTSYSQQYEIDTEINYPIADWVGGIELFYEDNSETTGYFEDNAYEIIITLYDSTGTKIDPIITKNHGFYAIIEANTMGQLITYNPFLPRKDKEVFWEKTRLLDNMYYATQTDQILPFKENLELLKALR